MSHARSTGRIRTKPPRLASKAKDAKQPRTGPGRPEGVSHVRDEILDAAEIEFANRGYAGTSLRNVADRAKVTQALINYYFRSKFGLFEDVFLRRNRELSEERMQRLSGLRRLDARAGVRAIVEAFFAPALAMRATPGGRTFMRLNARLHTEPQEISNPLRSAYDESTHAFAEALHAALPHLSLKDIHWRLALSVGGYLYVLSDAHRLDVIAPGICNPDDAHEVFAAIIDFITGGMPAPPLDAPVFSEPET